ncbi:MAG: membrane protein insertion efficiency factor YidD [Nitrospira sp.]|nr:membrane protein insertion efficiency factor YidD [Nitrospira sp.]
MPLSVQIVGSKLIVINRTLIITLSLIFFLLCVDLSRKPEHQFSANFLIFSIEQYRTYVSPRLSGIVVCKFKPSCSSYTITALREYGSLKGSAMSINRLLKCSPLSSEHGADSP